MMYRLRVEYRDRSVKPFDQQYADIRGVIHELSLNRAMLESVASSYTVTDEACVTLLHWQRDGQNTFGYLYDPGDPDYAFAASPDDVPLCIEGDDLDRLDRLYREGISDA